jgi:hypothetical protein
LRYSATSLIEAVLSIPCLDQHDMVALCHRLPHAFRGLLLAINRCFRPVRRWI